MRLYGCILTLFLPIRLLAQGQVGNCTVFPTHNIWNVPVDKLPVHPDSALYIATEGATTPLHPDFGANAAIPYNLVSADQTPAAVTFTGGQSDPGPYPVPSGAVLEAGTDSHLIVVDQDSCLL